MKWREMSRISLASYIEYWKIGKTLRAGTLTVGATLENPTRSLP